MTRSEAAVSDNSASWRAIRLLTRLGSESITPNGTPDLTECGLCGFDTGRRDSEQHKM